MLSQTFLGKLDKPYIRDGSSEMHQMKLTNLFSLILILIYHIAFAKAIFGMFFEKVWNLMQDLNGGIKVAYIDSFKDLKDAITTTVRNSPGSLRNAINSILLQILQPTG